MAFWPLIGKHLVDCVDYSFEFGELSNSRKQAIITLIKKKAKEKQNWRPVSLINVDTKIISKVKFWETAWKKVLPNLIHSNKNVFVKGKPIFDAVRLDIVDYSKRNGLTGILVAVDFEKAFNTVNFNFLIRTLHKFNFGPSFI